MTRDAQVRAELGIGERGGISPEDATREALRARVLAIAGGSAVRFEELDRMDEPGRLYFFRIWVGPPGAAKLYGGHTLDAAVERAERALKDSP